MDPIANLTEQREIARLLRSEDNVSSAESRVADGERLAELVIALDEWRSGGGFDPYTDEAHDPEDARYYVHDLIDVNIADLQREIDALNAHKGRMLGIADEQEGIIAYALGDDFANHIVGKLNGPADSHGDLPTNAQFAAIRNRLARDRPTVTGIFLEPMDLPSGYILVNFADGFQCGISREGEVSS